MDNFELLNTLHEAMVSLDNVYCLWTKKYGIGKNELCILGILLKNPGISQKQIVQKTGISFTTLNSSLKKMADQGCLYLETEASNKKEKHINLTGEGKGYAENILLPLWEIEEKTARKIKTKDIETAFLCVNRYKEELIEAFNKREGEK